MRAPTSTSRAIVALKAVEEVELQVLALAPMTLLIGLTVVEYRTPGVSWSFQFLREEPHIITQRLGTTRQLGSHPS